MPRLSSVARLCANVWRCPVPGTFFFSIPRSRLAFIQTQATFTLVEVTKFNCKVVRTVLRNWCDQLRSAQQR